MRRFLNIRPLRIALALAAACAVPAMSAPGPAPVPAVSVPVGALGFDESLLLALERNVGLKVDRLKPGLALNRLRAERAWFDPKASGSAATGRTIAEPSGSPERTTARLGLVAPLTTGGQAELALSGAGSHGAAANGSARAEFTLTQKIGQGGGRAATLARIREAKIDWLASKHELAGVVADLVRQAAAAWLDAVEAADTVMIQESALVATGERRRVTLERIAAGCTASFERAAVEAEAAERNEACVTARGECEKTRLQFAYLTGLAFDGGWSISSGLPALADEPVAPVDYLVGNALARRPELAQARFDIERNRLEVVRTENGLLPTLDLFVTLGHTGYADSFAAATRNAQTSGRDLQFGARFDETLFARGDRVSHATAVTNARVADLALENLARLVERDVRSAHLSATSADVKAGAVAATLAAREAAFRAEVAKFEAGRSDSSLVALAVRDLVAARLALSRARFETVRARINLARLDGTLLDRFDIE